MVLRDPLTLCAAMALPSHGPASSICRSSRWQAFSVTEPVFDPATRVERLYCLDCDDEMAHVTELYPEGVPPSECVVEQLRGEYLSFKNQGVHTNCDCFESDPYPAEDHPTMTNKNRRYFMYRTIAPKLGATGRRVKLPDCVVDLIEELYPADAAQPTVGFNE